MTVRHAAVAGQFYEADPDRLKTGIHALLGEAEDEPAVPPKVLIVPHAGHMYSGAVAARAYGQLRSAGNSPSRVVMFGPAHRVALEGMALPGTEFFRTPLGDVTLERESIDLAATLPGFCISDEAHRLEHCLEVQLPFLQLVLPGAALVPVLVGHCDAQTVAGAIDALWGGPETLLVISTDLSHFHNYTDAAELDRQTCQRLLARDSKLSGQDACGAFALNGLMRSRGAKNLEIELLQRCNSGDTGGDKQRVVGYAAFAMH